MNGRSGSLLSLRKNVGALQRVRDEAQPSYPVDDPSAPHVPLGSLSSSKKEAMKQCRAHCAAAAGGSVVVVGGSGLRWIALDLDEEAQAGHPRICSDSSPAQAIPIFASRQSASSWTALA